MNSHGIESAARELGLTIKVLELGPKRSYVVVESRHQSARVDVACTRQQAEAAIGPTMTISAGAVSTKREPDADCVEVDPVLSMRLLIIGIKDMLEILSLAAPIERA